MTSVGGTRPESSTRCTVGTAEKLRSSHIMQSGATTSVFLTTLSVKIDGNEAGNNLTSPERFYALNQSIKDLASRFLRRVSDGKTMPPTVLYSSTTEIPYRSPKPDMDDTIRDLFDDAGLAKNILDTVMELPRAQHLGETGLSSKLQSPFVIIP